MKRWLWFVALLCGAAVHGADIIWTNISGGAWSTAANWSPNQVPTINDVAWITNNGTYSVSVTATAAAANLVLGGTSGTQTLNHTAGTLSLADGGSSSVNGAYTLNGTATLTGSGTLTLGGSLNWISGTIGSALSNLVVLANGGLNISGSTGAKALAGGMLVNGAAGSWTGSQIAFDTSIFSNAPSGTSDLQADGNCLVLNSGTPIVVNSGTFHTQLRRLHADGRPNTLEWWQLFLCPNRAIPGRIAWRKWNNYRQCFEQRYCKSGGLSRADDHHRQLFGGIQFAFADRARRHKCGSDV